LLKKKTYRDNVVDYVYKAIRSEEFSPGDKILETFLAEKLKLSRAPIREALKQMAGDGLLVYKPQVGHFVAQMKPKDIVDAYAARGVLEGFAAMNASELFTKDDYFELEGMAIDMKKLVENGKVDEMIDLGNDFHDILFKKCGNLQIVQYTESLSLKLHLLFHKHWSRLYTPMKVMERHAQIVAALRKKDRYSIEQCIREHYNESGTRIAKLYE